LTAPEAVGSVFAKLTIFFAAYQIYLHLPRLSAASRFYFFKFIFGFFGRFFNDGISIAKFSRFVKGYKGD